MDGVINKRTIEELAKAHGGAISTTGCSQRRPPTTASASRIQNKGTPRMYGAQRALAPGCRQAVQDYFRL
jgi:hypothetical protein